MKTTKYCKNITKEFSLVLKSVNKMGVSNNKLTKAKINRIVKLTHYQTISYFGSSDFTKFKKEL